MIWFDGEVSARGLVGNSRYRRATRACGESREDDGTGDERAGYKDTLRTKPAGRDQWWCMGGGRGGEGRWAHDQVAAGLVGERVRRAYESLDENTTLT